MEQRVTEVKVRPCMSEVSPKVQASRKEKNEVKKKKTDLIAPKKTCKKRELTDVNKGLPYEDVNRFSILRTLTEDTNTDSHFSELAQHSDDTKRTQSTRTHWKKNGTQKNLSLIHI